MSRGVRSAAVQLSENQARLAHTALAALEIAYHCDVLAFIAQDENGIYVTLRPGDERKVAERLYDADWTGVFAAAMDQYPA